MSDYKIAEKEMVDAETKKALSGIPLLKTKVIPVFQVRNYWLRIQNLKGKIRHLNFVKVT